MSPEDFASWLRGYLKSVRFREGAILYSGVQTLQKGDLYVLGYNPGGEGGETLAKRIDGLLSRVDNAFLDERWENRSGKYPTGQAPFQRRYVALIHGLGYNPESVCSSNLVFFRSRDTNGVNYPVDANFCWKVHEKIIAIVQPKMILSLGTGYPSSYSYLRSQSLSSEEETCNSGHGDWECKAFRTTKYGRPLSVVAVPHLSRYDPSGKEDVHQWIRSFL